MPEVVPGCRMDGDGSPSGRLLDHDNLTRAGLCVTCYSLERQPLPYRLSRLARNRTWRDALVCKRRFQAQLC